MEASYTVNGSRAGAKAMGEAKGMNWLRFVKNVVCSPEWAAVARWLPNVGKTADGFPALLTGP